MTEDLRPVLLAGPDPREGIVGARSLVIEDEHDGFRDTYMYSADGNYRWRFDRRWSDGPSLTWVGLNPGTGDRDGTPRPTLKRMVKVSQQARYGALIVVNLFGWRSSSPKALAAVEDPVGIDNDVVVAAATSSALTDQTVVCWGSGAGVPPQLFRARAAMFGSRLISTPRVCLGTTCKGQPRHPLYVRASTALEPWRHPTSS